MSDIQPSLQNNGSIIVVDDDNELRSMLEDFLTSEDFKVLSFDSAFSAFSYFEQHLDEIQNYDLILSDIKMPQMDGYEFVDKVKSVGIETPIILMTAFASIPSAIEAIKKGAYDFVTKPFKLSEVILTINRAIRFRTLQKQAQTMASDIKKNWFIGSLIGKNPQVRQIIDTLPRIAEAHTPVLITGEAGTGKEAIARALHNASSRSQEPFISLDSTTMSESILEVELFGIDSPSRVKKGILSHIGKGTLFLNDVGDLDGNLQKKLLKVIEDQAYTPMGSTVAQPFNGRVIAATRKDLKKSIKENNFREDLYFRLSVVPIHLPPLRHRREDIPVLTEYFIHKYCATNKTKVKEVASKAMELLMRMRWDGNITELENTIERVVILCKGNVVHENDIPMPENETFETFYGKAAQDFPSLEQLEKRYMQLILEKVGGRKEKAAKILGINRRTLYRKEREFGFIHEDTPEPAEEN
jgi:DNA-binding NtrC family response regulator